MYDEAWPLAAAEVATGLGSWGPIANLAATGVMMGVLVWILTRRDPLERETNRIEIATTRKEFVAALEAERASREQTTEKFMAMLTTHREMSHNQRMEDRRVYQESLQTMLKDFLASVREIKNGNR